MAKPDPVRIVHSKCPTALLNSVKSLALVGVGLRVLNEANVIIRNIKISKVLASAGDAIGNIQPAMCVLVS